MRAYLEALVAWIGDRMEDASRSRAMTVREVAGYLNANEKTVYRLAQRGELPGSRWRG